VIGFLLVWGGLTQSDTAELDECPPAEETQVRILASLALVVAAVAVWFGAV
jgi:hypothetical protein